MVLDGTFFAMRRASSVGYMHAICMTHAWHASSAQSHVAATVESTESTTLEIEEARSCSKYSHSKYSQP